MRSKDFPIQNLPQVQIGHENSHYRQRTFFAREIDCTSKVIRSRIFEMMVVLYVIKINLSHCVCLRHYKEPAPKSLLFGNQNTMIVYTLRLRRM